MKKTFKKIKQLDIKIKKTAARYILTSGINLYCIIVVVIVCFLAFVTPYLNLVLVPTILWPACAVALAVYLRINIKTIVATCMLLFIFCAIAAIFNKVYTGEIFGNIAYFLLVVVVVKSILKYRKIING